MLIWFKVSINLNLKLPYKRICYFWVGTPGSPCHLLSTTSKWRCGITACKSIRESKPSTDLLPEPRLAAYSWTGSHRLFFPVPNSMQSCSIASWLKTETAMTMISVSTVWMQILILVWLFCAVCLTWRRILVSASSWLHGETEHLSIGILDTTVSDVVATITWLELICFASSLATRANNSSLYHSHVCTHQHEGIDASPFGQLPTEKTFSDVSCKNSRALG